MRPAGWRWLTVGLVAVVALGLLVIGGGLAVVLGIGADDQPSTDSVDAGFARDMSAHHLQGVEMANLAAERSQDPEVRQLALDISSTQTNQVGRMQGWLTLWELSISGGQSMAWMDGAAGDDMSSMEAGSGVTGSLMPGMATEDEVAELRGLSGSAFDVQFLRLMIRHHQGAKDMAEDAAANASQSALANLARTIAETQTAEVGTMTDMLTARGGTPLSAP
ncbi:conserved protein of unknown function [Modestobacter italicus]|uniref:DUF305 domain-containing protein n=1 Tax=Modestobacter italicus (strain DSM 44449 / CECT 9708 / BC 501) TaxID=2732864 RepID=I4EUM6_MODI5|nr:conserved protein of unknown function [Modestobacter marinus]